MNQRVGGPIEHTRRLFVAEIASVRTIMLNRPERRNAMTPEMRWNLIARSRRCRSSSCRALVLSGAGEAFCSGLDLSVLQAMQDKTAADHRARCRAHRPPLLAL